MKLVITLEGPEDLEAAAAAAIRQIVETYQRRAVGVAVKVEDGGD